MLHLVIAYSLSFFMYNNSPFIILNLFAFLCTDRFQFCPDTTADIAGMVLITAVMSLDSVPVLPFSSGNTVVAISSHIDIVRLS